MSEFKEKVRRQSLATKEVMDELDGLESDVKKLTRERDSLVKMVETSKHEYRDQQSKIRGMTEKFQKDTNDERQVIDSRMKKLQQELSEVASLKAETEANLRSARADAERNSTILERNEKVEVELKARKAKVDQLMGAIK